MYRKTCTNRNFPCTTNALLVVQRKKYYKSSFHTRHWYLRTTKIVFTRHRCLRTQKRLNDSLLCPMMREAQKCSVSHCAPPSYDTTPRQSRSPPTTCMLKQNIPCLRAYLHALKNTKNKSCWEKKYHYIKRPTFMLHSTPSTTEMPDSIRRDAAGGDDGSWG